MNNNIVWQPAKTIGNYDGYIGNLKSFAIGEVYSIQNKQARFFVMSDRFQINFTNTDTLDEAKGIAEERLSQFLSDTGLVFPAAEKEKLLPLSELKLVGIPKDRYSRACKGCHFFDADSDSISECLHPDEEVMGIRPIDFGCDVPGSTENNTSLIRKIFVPINQDASMAGGLA